MAQTISIWNNTDQRLCDWHGCMETKTHKAPKHRNAYHYQDYYYFCLAHVRYYNQHYDYYEGMSSDEIEQDRRADQLWRRPTWLFNGRQSPTTSYDTIFDIFDWYDNKAPTETHKTTPFFADSAEAKALNILGVSWPISLDNLKKHYKDLAKQYHPDCQTYKNTKGNENDFKKINIAYHVLKDYILHHKE